MFGLVIANKNFKQFRKYHAVFVFIDSFENNKYNFCSQILRDLIPSDLVKIQNPNEWKRIIVNNYSQDNGMTADDAKVTFLKIIYR